MKPSAEDLKRAQNIMVNNLTRHLVEEQGIYQNIQACIAQALADQREEDAKIVDAHAIAQMEGRASYTVKALEDAADAIRKGKEGL